ncbi:MAG TPA: hypothetical protein VJ011_06430 [Steroidobacteraceae bacterium]|nr:hypothetical protein [Steroidobacteraceae bacterium]
MGHSFETADQAAADTEPLPPIPDDEREFGHARRIARREATFGDLYAPAVLHGDDDECHVPQVIDAHQTLEQRLRHLREGAVKAEVSCLIREAANECLGQLRIFRRNGAHYDAPAVRQQPLLATWHCVRALSVLQCRNHRFRLGPQPFDRACRVRTPMRWRNPTSANALFGAERQWLRAEGLQEDRSRPGARLRAAGTSPAQDGRRAIARFPAVRAHSANSRDRQLICL